MALTIPTRFTAEDKFSGTIAKMSSNLSAFTARAERGLRSLTPVLSHIGKDMLEAFSVVAIAQKVDQLFESSFESAERYENAIASLSAASGLSGKALEDFEGKIKSVALATQRGDSETAEAFKTVGSLNPALYKNVDALGAVTKASIILGEATKTDLSSAATDLTEVMRAFKSPAEDSNRVINTLIATTNKGGISYGQLSSSIKNIGETARNANMTIEQTAAAIATVNKSTNLGEASGAGLQKVIVKLEKAHLGYTHGIFSLDAAIDQVNSRTDRMKGKQKDAYLSTLGLRGASIDAARALLNNKSAYDDLTKGVTGTNAAQDKAAIMMDTLEGTITRLKGAWDRMINNSNKAGTALNGVKNIIGFVSNHLDGLIKIGGLVLGFFALWKTAIILTNGVLWAMEFVQGIVLASMGLTVIETGAAAAGYYVYSAAMGIATGATWLFNAGLVVLEALFSPIGIAALAVVSIIMSLYRNWSMITDAFKNGGILSGILAIGNALGDAILYPLQKIMEIVAKFTGWDWASSAAKGIAGIRMDAGLLDSDENGNQVSGKKVIDNHVNQHEAVLQKQEQTNNANVGLTIDNRSGNQISTSNPNGIKIKTTSTMPAHGGGGSW